MDDFALHPQLERDTHRVGRLDVCHVLLHRNAVVPWWILVPEVEERELYCVPEPARSAIAREVDALSAFVAGHFPVEKLNVAAIGNVVPQLHVHVVGRRADDPCWPQPVWGHLNVQRAYAPDELRTIAHALGAALAGRGFRHSADGPA